MEARVIILVIYFCFLLFASIEDYKYHKVHPRWEIGIFSLGLLRLYLEQDNRWVTVTLTCLCFFLFYSLYSITLLLQKKGYQKLSFGGADVRMIPSMMLVQGWETALLGVFLGLLVALLKTIIRKEQKKELPLIPWISIGSMICQLYSLFLLL